MPILYMCLLFQLLPQGAAGELAPSASQVAQTEKLMEATPSQRIRSRNLFHPKRGLSAELGESPAMPESGWPSLLGTQLGKDHLGALLKWPGAEESRFLAKGETQEGLRLESVQRDRVTLLDVKAGKSRDLELNPESREGSGPGSELEQLFHPSTQGRGRKGKS